LVSFLVLLGVFIALRLPFARSTLGDGREKVDELNLTLSGVDRFLGAPFTNTHWPGMINQALLVPAISVDFLVQSRFRPTPEIFIEYLAATYRAPWSVLWLGRILVIGVASLGFASLALALARFSQRSWETVLGIIGITSIPELWDYTFRANGEGMGLGLLCLATVAAFSRIGSETAWFLRPLLAGLFAGLALACRNTLLPYLLFLAATLWMNSPDKRGRILLVFIAATGVFGVLGCPALWIEPIRFAKANLGNYRKQGAPIGSLAALRIMLAGAPVWFGGCSLLALIYAWFRGWSALCIGALAATALLIYTAAGSPFVNARYFISLDLVFGVLVVLTLAGIRQQLPVRLGRIYGWAVAGAALTLVFFGARTLAASASADAAISEAKTVRQYIARSAGKRIAIPFDYFYHTAAFATNRSFQTIGERLETALADNSSTADYLRGYGFAEIVAQSLPLDFNEKDRAFAARLRVMAAASHPGAVEIYYYGAESYAKRNGLLTAEEALTMLHHGQLDGVISTRLPTDRPEPGVCLDGNVVLLTRNLPLDSQTSPLPSRNRN